MRFSPGDKLGPYEITALIGKGGMGEVYRATDTRLHRPVAIKVSSREFNDRFEREAQAISALNHPNICTLYDIGPNYLVMELVEGEMLSKLIEKGPLPLDKALSYAVQIVDALSAAHARGIIHRDLKPANIIITRNGAKVLDFGLAKLSSERLPNPAADEIQTVTEPLTRAGAILGTLYYMAPEQVEGKETDERSDIFSFGVVFYEMLTGQRPFTGDTQAAILAAMLKDQPPPMGTRQPTIPHQLERVVRKCLEKKPEDRWHSARDLKPTLELIDLEAPSVGGATASVPIPVQTPPRKSWLLPAIAAVALVAIAGLAWTFWPKAAAPATRFQVTLPPNVNLGQYVSVSPDGRKLVFTENNAGGLWAHDLNTLDWRKLAGTEGAAGPFWSPDSRSLGFAVDSHLKRIDLTGGPPQTLCTVDGAGIGSGAWSKEDVILFGTRPGVNSRIRRVSASGGVPVDLTELDLDRGQRAHALPYFLPDGKHFLYLAITGSAGASAPGVGIYSGSIDAKPAEQSKQLLLTTPYAAPYVDGRLFFMRDGTLMTQPFDAGKLQLQGEPVPVAEHVGIAASNGLFSVSPAGVLVYRTGKAQGAGGYQLTWYDRDGTEKGTVGEPGPINALRLSPDETRVALRDLAQGQPGDIWLVDIARGVRTRLTFRQSAGTPAIWSPDGARVAYAAGAERDAIYEKSASGAGEEKELFKKTGVRMAPTSWSRDGRFLLYNDFQMSSLPDLWVLSLDGERKSTLLLSTKFGEGGGSFSPDGRWVAYISDESGRNEVYIRPFVASQPKLGDGKWQLSKDGASTQIPKWSKDGKEIVFGIANNLLMAVDVNGSGESFQMGTPKQVFTRAFGGAWDVTGDGKRFLFVVPPGQAQTATQEPITVVLNWQADLKK